MKRIDWQIIVGGLLIFGGFLEALQQLGVINNAPDLFWGLVFGLGAAGFFYVFATNRSQWWAAFPAFLLLGLAGVALLPASFSQWDSLVFLGSLGLGFFAVYLTSRENWWALIPGGVLLTLGVVSVLNVLRGYDSGNLFFFGLGITFLLVAVLPGPGDMRWAYFPAVILLAMSILLGLPTLGLMAYFWPSVLIAAGLLLVYLYFRRRA